MRLFDYDYDDLDEFEFDSFAATRRLTDEKQYSHHRPTARKHHSKRRKERWENNYSDDYDFDDYDDDEFDKYYGMNIKH